MLPREFHPVDNKIRVLSNPYIWIIDNRDLLGEYLSDFVETLIEIIPNYVRNGYPDKMALQVNIKPKLLKEICYWLSEDYKIMDAIFEANGWRGILGVEFGKYELRKYHNTYGELPLTTQFNSLSGSIRKGRWRKYGIHTWNELLKQVFGETNVKDLGYYSGEGGFENAVREAKEFEQKEGRLPKTSDLFSIKTKITEGYWRELGIYKWNDFLLHVFDSVNVDRSIDYSEYEGEDGLRRAQHEVLQFKKNHNKNPRISNFQYIDRIITNGLWDDLGISNWNEFLLETTGEINVQHNKYLAYQGKKGLNKAQGEVKLFEKNNGRMPKRRDIRAINQAIMNGYWEKFEIYRFNDFLKKTFGKINMKANGYYKGKRGLNRAIREGLDFYKANNKLPAKRDLRTLYSLITDRGYWKEFGIMNWGDYKSQVKLKINNG